MHLQVRFTELYKADEAKNERRRAIEECNKQYEKVLKISRIASNECQLCKSREKHRCAKEFAIAYSNYWKAKFMLVLDMDFQMVSSDLDDKMY